MPRRAKIEEFTDRFVRTAPAGDHTERRRRGFSLRVTEEGVRRFSLRYVAPCGKQRRLLLGDYPGVTLAQAHNAADEALLLISKKGDPASERRRAAAAARNAPVKTIQDLWESYERRQKARVRASTLAHAKDLYDRHLKSAWGDLSVGEVEKGHALKVLGELEEAGRVTTRNRLKGLIGALYGYATDHLDLSVKSPVRGLESLDEPPRHRILNDDELRTIWNALDRPVEAAAPLSASVALALMLAATTLQRRGEVAGIDEAELNLRQRTWLLPAERSKNGRPHLIPLSPLGSALISILIEHIFRRCVGPTACDFA